MNMIVSLMCVLILTVAARAELRPANAVRNDLLPVAKPQVLVELVDGSRIRGQSQTVSFPVETSLGEITLALEKLDSIRCKDDPNRTEVFLRNGDRLTGKLKLPSVRLHTLIGEIVVPVGKILLLGIATALPMEGLVMRYSFDDEDATHITELVSNTTSELRAARKQAVDRRGNVLLLEGEQGGVPLAKSPALNFGKADFSVSIWFTTPRLRPAIQQIFWSSYNPEIQIEASGAIGSSSAKFCAGIQSKTRVEPNHWTHLLLVREDGTGKLYINGTLEGTCDASTCVATPDGQVLIGFETIMGEPFAGMIDELSLWNRALTELEIKSLYDQFRE